MHRLAVIRAVRGATPALVRGRGAAANFLPRTRVKIGSLFTSAGTSAVCVDALRISLTFVANKKGNDVQRRPAHCLFRAFHPAVSPGTAPFPAVSGFAAVRHAPWFQSAFAGAN